MNEFTGERVIPGQVETDLWNEHFARYAFAARCARGRKVLDIGCGSGYGSAELSREANSVVGLDISAEAVAHARSHFPLPNVRFLAASASSIPFAASTFDLVTAFEVIEHLPDWDCLIREARRVLSPGGLFIVSTPNKRVYTESRGPEGANPFHVHEFEAQEFAGELQRVFKHTHLLLQNRTEAFAFYPPKTFRDVDARLDSSSGESSDAHFFVAVCSDSEVAPPRTFVYVPRAANVLREREQHIALLEHELNLNRKWLEDSRDAHARLLEAHAAQKEHLEQQNRWALDIERQWKADVAQLQHDSAEVVRGYEAKIAELDEDVRQRTEWALETERRLSAEIVDLRSRYQDQLATSEATVTERTQWALELQAKLDLAEAQLAGVRASRWFKLGGMFGIGPPL